MDKHQDWFAARVRLMLKKAEADLEVVKPLQQILRNVGPRLIASLVQSLRDSCAIHSESLEKEIEALRNERDVWRRSTEELQRKLNALMLAETRRETERVEIEGTGGDKDRTI